MKFIRFIRSKIFGYKEEREEYKDIASDVYSHGILKYDEIEETAEEFYNDKKEKGNDF